MMVDEAAHHGQALRNVEESRGAVPVGDTGLNAIARAERRQLCELGGIGFDSDTPPAQKFFKEQCVASGDPVISADIDEQPLALVFEHMLLEVAVLAELRKELRKMAQMMPDQPRDAIDLG